MEIVKDVFAELREAQKDGKRIVWQASNGDWIDETIPWQFNGAYSANRYKIVSYDTFTVVNLDLNDIGLINLKITKSGIDGKLSFKHLNC